MNYFIYISHNERNLCQDLLTIENTSSDVKLHALHRANKLLVRVTGLSKTFSSLLNTQKQSENNVWEESNDAFSLSIGV